MRRKEKSSKKLEKISDRIRKYLTDKDAAREQCLKSCREIIRLSSNAIRATHRREDSETQNLINTAALLIKELQEKLKPDHPDLLSANYVHDAYKEFAEASITSSIIFKGNLPDPEQLGITYPAYLNGLAESVGELRRYLLDSLRFNEFSQAEELLNIMDNIYSILVTMDFPDGITYGLRRNTDVVRGIVEKTRGELTLIIQNNLLQLKIDSLNQKSA